MSNEIIIRLPSADHLRLLLQCFDIGVEDGGALEFSGASDETIDETFKILHQAKVDHGID